MMITALLMLQVEPPHMTQARYLAMSSEPDTQAPGGYGTTDNKAVLNNANTPREFLSIRRVGDQVEVNIVNRNNSNLWVQATDSNMRGWLEAKKDGKWVPIQYHWWSSCGNSYHRVKIAEGHHFSYQPVIAKGDFKTEVRFTLLTNQNRSREMEPVSSAPVKMSISEGSFELGPKESEEYKVTLDWTVPTLIPKDMGRF